MSKTRSFEGEYNYLPERNEALSLLSKNHIIPSKTKKESIFDEIVKLNDVPGPCNYNPDKLKLMRCSTSTTFSKATFKRCEILDPINTDFPEAGQYNVK